MKRLVLQSLALLMASMFLLSFTGIRMLIHHCLACETTTKALIGLAPENCQQFHLDHTGAAACHLPSGFSDGLQSDCCPGDEDVHGHACGSCCESEVEYLKNDYQVVQEKQGIRIDPVAVAPLTPMIPVVAVEESVLPGLSLCTATNTDPPRFVGREFVIFAHQLVIS